METQSFTHSADTEELPNSHTCRFGIHVANRFDDQVFVAETIAHLNQCAGAQVIVIGLHPSLSAERACDPATPSGGLVFELAGALRQQIGELVCWSILPRITLTKDGSDVDCEEALQLVVDR